MSNELTKALEAIEQSEQLNKPWPKAATDDHAAALDAMPARVEYTQDEKEREAFITFSWVAEALLIWQGFDKTKQKWVNTDFHWPRAPWRQVTPEQTREFALALTVLAEIAERWEREAREAARQ